MALENCNDLTKFAPQGRGYSTTLYTGRLRPKVQPLTLFYATFDRKGTHFLYLLLTNGTPFTFLV